MMVYQWVAPFPPQCQKYFYNIQNKITLNPLNKKFNIICYGHYVDDIIVAYNSSKDTGETILNEFNKIHPKIQFTIEKQNKIIYLYLQIQKQKFQKQYKFNFDIYHKPTTTKLSINYNSLNPNSHKWANVQFFIAQIK